MGPRSLSDLRIHDLAVRTGVQTAAEFGSRLGSPFGFPSRGECVEPSRAVAGCRSLTAVKVRSETQAFDGLTASK